MPKIKMLSHVNNSLLRYGRGLKPFLLRFKIVFKKKLFLFERSG